MSRPNYDIPENHASFMRTMLRLSADEAVPESLHNAYYRMRLCFDKVGINVTEREIAWLLFMDSAPLPDQEPVLIADMWFSKELSYGDQIGVVFRNKRQIGLIHNVTPEGNILAELNGEEREFLPKNTFVLPVDNVLAPA